MNQPAWRSGAILTVLFDLDDTLLDSFAARASALQDVFSLADVDTPTEELDQERRRAAA